MTRQSLTLRAFMILGKFACSQYRAVEITSLVVEQYSVVYKISIPKCLYFITYVNRRLGTWLIQSMLGKHCPVNNFIVVK